MKSHILVNMIYNENNLVLMKVENLKSCSLSSVLIVIHKTWRTYKVNTDGTDVWFCVGIIGKSQQ